MSLYHFGYKSTEVNFKLKNGEDNVEMKKAKKLLKSYCQTEEEREKKCYKKIVRIIKKRLKKPDILDRTCLLEFIREWTGLYDKGKEPSFLFNLQCFLQELLDDLGFNELGMTYDINIDEEEKKKIRGEVIEECRREIKDHFHKDYEEKFTVNHILCFLQSLK